MAFWSKFSEMAFLSQKLISQKTKPSGLLEGLFEFLFSNDQNAQKLTYITPIVISNKKVKSFVS